MDSENKFAHAKKWKGIIDRFELRTVNVREFCNYERVDCSTLYRNLQKYRDANFDGLIDHRHGTSYKITLPIKKYIMESKIKNNKKSGADIANGIKNKFGVEISRSQINRKLKELGLNDPAGRKTGKRLKKTSD